MQQESLMNLNRVEALLRNKMLLKACVIQGALPVLSFVPMVLYVGLQLSYGVPENLIVVGPEWALFAVLVLLNTLFDAATTLYVVVAYRDNITALFWQSQDR